MPRGHKITSKQEKSIVDMYNDGHSSLVISKKINLSKTRVLKVIRKYGLTRKDAVYRKYFFNENFFDVIDNESKAYILGMLYSDGCNALEHGNVSFCQHKKDKYILQYIKESIGYTGEIKSITGTNCNEIRLCSRKMCKKLNELGCTPRKSLTIEFPDYVPQNLMHHFIRGYFDGDGCIHMSKINQPSITIESSEYFVLKLKEYLKSFRNIDSNIKNRNNTESKRLKITGLGNIVKFWSYIYDNGTVFLIRKKEIFDNIIIDLRERFGTGYGFCYFQDEKLKEICEILNLPYTKSLRYSCPSTTTKTIIDNYKNGKSIRSLTDETGISQKHIVKILKDSGIKIRNKNEQNTINKHFRVVSELDYITPEQTKYLSV